MTKKSKPLAWHTLALGATMAAVLVACGGGGGSATTATPVTLSGVAATGAAFEGAIIVVTDKTGAEVGRSATVGTDGTFSITLSATAQAPFVLTATRTNAEGVAESLVSVVPVASTTTSTVNVSPVTTLIASRLSPNGDPAQLSAQVAAGTATITPTTVTASVTEVKTILAPLLTATGTTNQDPLTATFATNGTGYDRLLDSLKVSIVPASSTTSNIEIAVKEQLATDNTPPTAITFTSTATTPPALPALTGTLVPDGTAAKIASFLTRLTACYALPGSTRVSSTFTSGNATGTAADVIAPECTSLFHTSVATFKNNGATVGRSSDGSGAFASLFRDAATGTTFSQGSYEFSRSNGDIVIGYKSRDTAGNEQFDTLVVRADSADGDKLKLIGNQYIYPGGVIPYQQLREFVSQASSNYYSTGYDLRVPLIPGVSYVNVTPPNGNSYVSLLRGSDGMVFPVRSDLSRRSGTAYLRLASAYKDATGTPSSHPRDLEGALFFAQTDRTDDQLAAIPNQGVWKFEYYSGTPVLASIQATGGTLLATQYFKTRNRANTIAELKTKVWASLSDASITDMVNRRVAGATVTGSYATLPSAAAMSVSWTVPTGALPPTQVKVFGNAMYYDYDLPGGGGFVTPDSLGGFTSTTNSTSYSAARTPFNDGQTVGSTARSSTVTCANGAIDINRMGEKHCANPGPGYLASARQTGLHLWARDPSGREYARFYAPYTLQ